MRTEKTLQLAVAMLVCGLATPATAQVVPVEPTIVDERPVVMVPSGAGDLSGSYMTGGVSIRVSTDGNLRTYRAFHEGRIHTAYEDASRPATRLAFDPAERRFRTLSSTIRIELLDSDSIDSLARDHGALYGNAYPELGFALIRLGRDADIARAVELLNVDARVREANLQFEPPLRRPMIAPVLGIRPKARTSLPPVKTGTMDSLSLAADLSIFPEIDIQEGKFAQNVTVANLGAGRSEAGTLRAELFRIVPDDSTMDEDDLTMAVVASSDTPIAALDGKGARQEVAVRFGASELDAGETYYVLYSFLDATEMLDDADTLARGYGGFTLDSLNRVQHVCIEPGRGSSAGTADPLLTMQWNMENTGQTANAASGGVSGEDLQMDDVLMDGPTGEGVRVAVVDTGLEICHPDLRANVEAGASHNFNAIGSSGALLMPEAFRLDANDPFNFDSAGGHGTSVAGIIAAEADNGIGVRGVAPDVRLRGYNMLNATDQLSALVGSLGASSFLPNSSDVDIFNLSWGGTGESPVNVDPTTERVFAYGTQSLRSGLGAIYVKAAGNSFGSCRSLKRDINDRIGCISSNAGDVNNLPYVINVGAFNAHGERSSYSSAGPNLWVSAPGGEYGISEPALPSVDQMGFKRGLPVLLEPLFGSGAPLDDASTGNPDGDYTALMNGTSAAAPNVTGAVALLLEEEPGLTWRDVKYVLAKTARKIDPNFVALRQIYGSNVRTVLLAWTDNAAGYSYHDWYGFGAVDVDAALDFLDDYTPDSLGEFRQSGWFENSGSLSIPDNDGAGATQTLSVSGLANDANIEAVTVEIDLSHEFPNDLGIQLVSPHGTRTVINQVFNETLALGDGTSAVTFGWRILSNAFFGETPNGDWQIDMFDAAAEDTGTLDAWRLQFHYGTHSAEDAVDDADGDENDGDGDST